ncbi:MAG: hypothetical protein ACJ797_28865 [Ktedonobacteraceae bacterium]
MLRWIPEGVIGLVEHASAQSQDRIQTLGSPSHPGSFSTGGDHGFASCLGHPTANMHAFGPKGRIPHALGIREKIIRFNGGNGARSTGPSRDGGELLDHVDQFLNLSMREPVIGLLGPSRPLWRSWSVHGIGHVPDMFSRMGEIHTMGRMGKVVLSYASNPTRSIS